ncbi:MAG: IS1634 family transposase [Planctomycetes bacterium]|nr:IS1634 family transposase [Planctomycetota bacterium]
MFTYSPEVENLARKHVRRIIKQEESNAVYRIRAGKAVADRESEYVPDYQVVDVNSTENEESRSVGAEHVVLETVRGLGIDEKLLEMGFSRPWKDVAISVIAGRLINPCSELETHWWLRHKSAIDELMGTDFSLLPQDRVYRVADKLLTGRDELEDYLSFKEKTLFNLQETIILYDLTNTFVEGTGKLNNKAMFGVSKEKRYDCPLVTLGLVLDGDGFPKRSRVFEGNVSEGKTLEKMLLGLEKEALLIKPLIIVDAGIATEDNLKWLRDNHYEYLAVSRRRKHEIPGQLASRMVTVKEDKQALVRAVLEHDEKTKEVEVWCHSIQKEKKEEGIKNLSRQRFEEGLKKIEASLSKKNGIKGYEKVIERIGRLKERYSRTARHFEITVEKNDKDRVISLSWNLKKDLENTDGVYCLRTNRQGLNEQALWDLYNTLRDVEDAFRCMKSELGFRPIRHHNERRSDGHLFITVLAYHILHAIRFKLRNKGIHDSWSTIRERLSMHTRNTTTLKREDGRVIHIRKSSRPEPHQKIIYDALNIASMLGRMVKKIL